MKLTSRAGMAMILSATILLTVANPSWCQVWWEETGNKYEYDLSPYCILILLGDDFDYHETVVVKRHWEDWGASVDIAGTDTQLTGHEITVRGNHLRRKDNLALVSVVHQVRNRYLFRKGPSDRLSSETLR